jgi:hypothetical protein
MCSYVSVYEWCNTHMGSAHKDTLKALNGLAASSNDNGDFAAARALYSQCLELQRQHLGDDHADTMQTAGGMQPAFTAPHQRHLLLPYAFVANSLC